MTKVYRGKPEYVHIQDGERAVLGRTVAGALDRLIRANAAATSKPEDDIAAWDNPLCPGCYMVAVFNCAIELARRNGQSLTELGNSLGNAFKQLAMDGDYAESIESIEVQLDACEIKS